MVSRLLCNWQAFPGDKRLIDVARTLGNFSVDGNPLAGPHHHQITHMDRSHRDIFVPALAAHARLLRAQGLERTDCLGCLALRARLEPFAQKHQGNDDGGSFKIQMRDRSRCGACPLIQAQAIRRTGTECHEQIHITGAGHQCFPASAIEACAEVKLHRSVQQKLRPSRQHEMAAGDLEHHWHHQRKRQERGGDDVNGVPTGGRHFCPLRCIRLFRADLEGRLVTRLLYRFDNLAYRDRAGNQFDRCLFSGEIDGDLHHARQFANRLLDSAGA